MTSTASILRIAVIGAGRIGSAFAFHLARTGGHEVSVVAREGSARLRQLEEDQAIVHLTGDSAPVHVTNKLDEAISYDLVIVTVLAHQIFTVLPILERSAAKRILFMFNTFEPERLEESIGPERCCFGMPFVQATLDERGRLAVVVGAAGQRTLVDRQQWVDLFNTAGLAAMLESEMPLWLRCHAPFCVAFESVSVAAQRRGGGATWTDAVRISQGVHASFSLIKQQGYEIYPQAKRRIDASPIALMASMLWFMSRIRSFRDVLATGEAECRELIGVMAAAAPPDLASEIRTMNPA